MHLLMAGVTAPSHVYPSLALISELVSRGHRVSYVVGERLAELVALTGAEVAGHPSVLPDADTNWPEDIGEAMQLFLDEAASVLGPMLARFDRPGQRPDAVLYDIGGFAGRVAAERWGVPAVQLSPTYVAWEGYDRDMAEQTDAIKASPRVDPAALGPLPAGVRAARVQPQLDVLAHASVFITHAGMGSTVESLWFGVPTVAIPQAVDQFTNAAQLEALGAGVQLPDEQWDAARLRTAVDTAAGCAERARELRREVRRHGGVGMAANAVERLCRVRVGYDRA